MKCTAQCHVGRNYIGLGIKSTKETSNGEEIEMVIEQCETVSQREALKKINSKSDSNNNEQ